MCSQEELWASSLTTLASSVYGTYYLFGEGTTQSSAGEELYVLEGKVYDKHATPSWSTRASPSRARPHRELPDPAAAHGPTGSSRIRQPRTAPPGAPGSGSRARPHRELPDPAAAPLRGHPTRRPLGQASCAALLRYKGESRPSRLLLISYDEDGQQGSKSRELTPEVRGKEPFPRPPTPPQAPGFSTRRLQQVSYEPDKLRKSGTRRSGARGKKADGHLLPRSFRKLPAWQPRGAHPPGGRTQLYPARPPRAGEVLGELGVHKAASPGKPGTLGRLRAADTWPQGGPGPPRGVERLPAGPALCPAPEWGRAKPPPEEPPPSTPPQRWKQERPREAGTHQKLNHGDGGGGSEARHRTSKLCASLGEGWRNRGRGKGERSLLPGHEDMRVVPSYL
ncbi:uncharacterized protein [Notamacropus eugenii]|uniref:uncharacterized protein n=1 Tax=Notamacropus eugenii TaxID=9315 RepID=UPI003B676502